MSDDIETAPSPVSNARANPALASDIAGWLGDLLDMARDRGDAALARLIAGLADDLAGRAPAEN